MAKTTTTNKFGRCSDPATIEQDSHDVEEVWGSGQPQIRDIATNLAVATPDK